MVQGPQPVVTPGLLKIPALGQLLTYRSEMTYLVVATRSV